ncbi:hypothetical protein BS17DRAFT_785863 [Gyrodon lividus]|nr:hypothetical protein BS17DRAFT_785863 [Gyrodon lividus]
MLITQGDTLMHPIILPLVFVPTKWPTQVATPSIEQNSVQDASQALMVCTLIQNMTELCSACYHSCSDSTR